MLEKRQVIVTKIYRSAFLDVVEIVRHRLVESPKQLTIISHGLATNMRTWNFINRKKKVPSSHSSMVAAIERRYMG